MRCEQRTTFSIPPGTGAVKEVRPLAALTECEPNGVQARQRNDNTWRLAGALALAGIGVGAQTFAAPTHLRLLPDCVTAIAIAIACVLLWKYNAFERESPET